MYRGRQVLSTSMKRSEVQSMPTSPPTYNFKQKCDNAGETMDINDMEYIIGSICKNFHRSPHEKCVNYWPEYKLVYGMQQLAPLKYFTKKVCIFHFN